MVDEKELIGNNLHSLAQRLYPICRSLTGDGVRETLTILQEYIPKLNMYEVPTGSQCSDWTVPDEWNIKDAYIIDPAGIKIVDFNASNLHVMGYSEPVDEKISLKDLLPHLYSDAEQPEAIPYRTSYYERRWGFCLSHDQLSTLQEGEYHVYIDSTLTRGSMSYGELLIKGESQQEIFISTYICHPSMANNELSGIVVTTFIAQWLLSQENLRYSYRIIFIPETLGSICYLSKYIDVMKKNIIAGFNVTCIGDEGGYSFLHTRAGDTLVDSIVEHVLKNIEPNYVVYPFIESGSDERQYGSPGVDLPVVSVMRSKYNEYPEYHTSFDDMSVITPNGLYGGYRYLLYCIECLEANQNLNLLTLAQPQLGKRGLYPNLSKSKLGVWHKSIVDLLSYADGRSLLEIADEINMPMWELFDVVDVLKQHNLIVESAI